MRHTCVGPGMVLSKFFVALIMGATVIGGCSSAPEPQAEPSKKEIRQDADGFFKKMDQEETKPSNP